MPQLRDNTVINNVFLVHINLPEKSGQQSVHSVMLISTWVIGDNYVTSVNSQFYINLKSTHLTMQLGRIV